MNEKEILRIVNALGTGTDSYYVYMLCETINGINNPFYIGKGIRDRIFQHELGAEEEKNKIENDNTLSAEEKANALNSLSYKHRKISELGIDNVTKVIVKWGLTEYEAFMAESALINAYTLTNGRDSLTNIVNGHMSEREKSNVSCTTKARTLTDFLTDCAAPEIDITEIKEAALFLKITTLYPECMKLPRIKQETAIYDSARACWKLNENKVPHIKYVFVLYNSQVVGIYPVNLSCWKQRNKPLDDFPSFPEIRKSEKEFSNLSFTEFKSKCLNPKVFLNISSDDVNLEKKYDAWKKRYYFSKLDTDIPDDILKFKNCVLVKPNGEKFFSGKGNQSEIMYNFECVKKDIRIRNEKDYN